MTCQRGDPRSDVNGHATHARVRAQDLSRVDARADGYPDGLQLIANGERTPNRSDRSIEHGKKAITRGVHLLATEELELSANCLVMQCSTTVPTPHLPAEPRSPLIPLCP